MPLPTTQFPPTPSATLTPTAWHSHALLHRNLLLLPPYICSCLASHLESPPSLCFICLNAHPWRYSRVLLPPRVHRQISLPDLPSFAKSCCVSSVVLCALGYQLGLQHLRGRVRPYFPQPRRAVGGVWIRSAVDPSLTRL